MQVFRQLSTLRRHTRDERGSGAVAIGGFDGLHLGHQEILRRTQEWARAHDVSSLVFSFEPLPREYLSPQAPPPRLTRFRERVELLRAMGVARFFCPRFDAAMQRQRADEFIDRFLVHGVRPACVLVGEGFRFGHRREGTVADLQAAGQRYGFEVVPLGSVCQDGRPVSSSWIREALAVGDLPQAQRLLGRPYSMTGRVLPGRRLGRELGFPTANVGLGRRVSPVQGVFAVRVHGLDRQAFDAVASVGTRPTVSDGGEVWLEVHIFDFAREIYGRRVTVEFVARLREERHFASLPEMVEQMQEDCAQARALLAT